MMSWCVALAECVQFFLQYAPNRAVRVLTDHPWFRALVMRPSAFGMRFANPPMSAIARHSASPDIVHMRIACLRDSTGLLGGCPKVPAFAASTVEGGFNPQRHDDSLRPTLGTFQDQSVGSTPILQAPKVGCLRHTLGISDYCAG
jgi:hypothetical protein